MERIAYVIISDRERKDFNCPGYIQSALSSPTGARIIVRVYSPTDQDSMGTKHCLNVDQVASVDQMTFRKYLSQVTSARKDRENAGKNMTLNELGKYITNEHTRNFVNREWFAGINDTRCETKVDYNGISRRNNMMKYGVKEIIYHDAATIVYWTDGTKTVVKCNENDEYSEYAGFVAAVAKKMYGGANAINRLIDSKKVVHGNGLRQPFRPKTTLEEIFDNALKNVTGAFKSPMDPLIRPDLYPHIHDSARNSSPFMEGDDPIRDENG